MHILLSFLGEKTYLVPKRGTLWMVEIEEDIEAVDVGGTCFIFDLRFIVWPFKFTFKFY